MKKKIFILLLSIICFSQVAQSQVGQNFPDSDYEPNIRQNFKEALCLFMLYSNGQFESLGSFIKEYNYHMLHDTINQFLIIKGNQYIETNPILHFQQIEDDRVKTRVNYLTIKYLDLDDVNAPPSTERIAKIKKLYRTHVYFGDDENTLCFPKNALEELREKKSAPINLITKSGEDFFEYLTEDGLLKHVTLSNFGALTFNNEPQDGFLFVGPNQRICDIMFNPEHTIHIATRNEHVKHIAGMLVDSNPDNFDYKEFMNYGLNEKIWSKNWKDK